MGAYEVNGQAFPDGVFTQTFASEGELITAIQDGGERTAFHHEYQIAGGELVIDGPREYAQPNHARMRFWFGAAGDLLWEDGQGGVSRFRRV